MLPNVLKDAPLSPNILMKFTRQAILTTFRKVSLNF